VTMIHGPVPEHGLLIISPVLIAGAYDRHDTYARFRSLEPVDMIGNSLLVFDLDRLEGTRVRK
jgi:hypothetical protein